MGVGVGAGIGVTCELLCGVGTLGTGGSGGSVAVCASGGGTLGNGTVTGSEYCDYEVVLSIFCAFVRFLKIRASCLSICCR